MKLKFIQIIIKNIWEKIAMKMINRKNREKKNF